MSRRIIFHRRFVTAIIALIIAAATCTQPCTAKDFVVMIDAGHGGKDSGALGPKCKEKDINLAVALKLGKELSNRYKDIKVVYTRTTDVFVTIKGRMDKAKEAKADLFISLHCNSAAFENPRRTSLSGTSVYVLGNSNANDNIDLAMRENSAILLEDNYQTTYKGFDNSPEYYIFTEINQSKMMGKSNAFANEVQKQLVSHAGLKDNHVNETSRLWLLLHSTMPAILVEMDYICNPNRESFLNSESGCRKIAEAISNGVENYRKTLGHSTSNNKNKTKASTTKANNETNEETASATAAKQNKTGKITYKIQIFTTPTKVPAGSSKLKGLSPVEYYSEGKLYKYTFGDYDSLEEANAALKEIKKKFSDAFIIKTKDGQRIK